MPASGASARYLRLTLLVLLVACGLAAVGYFPTKRLAGDAGLVGMLAGIAVSVVASLAAGVVAVQGGGNASGRLNIALASMLVRFAVALVLGLSLALSGFLELRSLLIWLAISYMALLVIDTWFVLGAGDGEK